MACRGASPTGGRRRVTSDALVLKDSLQACTTRWARSTYLSRCQHYHHHPAPGLPPPIQHLVSSGQGNTWGWEPLWGNRIGLSESDESFLVVPAWVSPGLRYLVRERYKGRWSIPGAQSMLFNQPGWKYFTISTTSRVFLASTC